MHNLFLVTESHNSSNIDFVELVVLGYLCNIVLIKAIFVIPSACNIDCELCAPSLGSVTYIVR